MLSLLSTAVALSLALPNVAALPTISVKGSKFFAAGQQFFLKGVAYQGTPADPLVDVNQCQLDAASMKTIGTNSIRVYHVNPWENHDGCMSAFDGAGIYIWLDLDTFNTTIFQGAPEWSATQFLAFAQVMDVFQQYDNLGGFWIGNEVVNMPDGAPAAPFVKAATADMKSYMAAKNYRQIPIGYSAADIAELRPMLQNYLACGEAAQSIDFFGLNSYEWCGSATYQTSGYANLQAMSLGYSIPIFFSETGCNVGGPRTFGDQEAIFGPDMIETWSGSIIYEWVQETNHYGLVNYPNNQIYSGGPIPISPDFPNLQNVWSSIHPSGIAEAAYTPSFSAPPCPAATSGWNVNGAVALPLLGDAIIQSAVNNKLVPSQAAPQTSVSKTVQATNTGIASSPSSTPSSVVPKSVVPSTSLPPSPVVPASTTSTATTSPSQLVPSFTYSSTSSAGAAESSSSSPTESSVTTTGSTNAQQTSSAANPSTSKSSASSLIQTRYHRVPFGRFVEKIGGIAAIHKRIGKVGWGFDESCRWEGDEEQALEEKRLRYDVSNRVHYRDDEHGFTRKRWESVGHIRWKGNGTTGKHGKSIYHKDKGRRKRPMLILGVERMSGEMVTPAVTPGGFGGGFHMGGFMAPFDGASDDGVAFLVDDTDDEEHHGSDGWSFDEGVDILDVPLLDLPERVKGKARESLYTLRRS